MLSLVKQVDVASAHLCAPVPKHSRHATKTCPSALPCLHIGNKHCYSVLCSLCVRYVGKHDEIIIHYTCLFIVKYSK